MTNINEFVVRRMNELVKDSGAGFSLNDTEMKIISEMAYTTIMMLQLNKIFNDGSPESIADFAREIYSLGENINDVFPLPNIEGPMLGFCVACKADGKEEGGPCDHKRHGRAAMLLTSMFKIMPEYDMDIEEGSESDDPNEGMVTVEDL